MQVAARKARIGAPCVSDNLPTGLDARRGQPAVEQKVYAPAQVGSEDASCTLLVLSAPGFAIGTLLLASSVSQKLARGLSKVARPTIPSTAPILKPRRFARNQNGKRREGDEGKQEDEAEGPGQGRRTSPTAGTSCGRSPGADPGDRSKSTTSSRRPYIRAGGDRPKWRRSPGRPRYVSALIYTT